MLGVCRDDLGALLGRIVPGIINGHEGNVARHYYGSSRDSELITQRMSATLAWDLGET
ncbi:hypothetical protein MPLDJ20_110354 [Mesorhizobium plurifarium]|uniref:Uncharacterized protein n=1 Tax=Mesorhizobium plurifarium TaxID=69974 RepID=A0A090E1P0_MESPL|nr:hypothetical protein MPLDJ20_110354 [Mesorhizobium plurifarium]